MTVGLPPMALRPSRHVFASEARRLKHATGRDKTRQRQRQMTPNLPGLLRTAQVARGQAKTHGETSGDRQATNNVGGKEVQVCNRSSMQQSICALVHLGRCQTLPPGISTLPVVYTRYLPTYLLSCPDFTVFLTHFRIQCYSLLV